MSSAFYINTNRPYMARGAVEAAQKALRSCSLDIPVYVVDEPQHVRAISREIRGTGAKHAFLPRDNMGLAYSRNRMVEHAARLGFSTIITIDDDMEIRCGSDIPEWLRIARRPDVVGVGSYRSPYGLLFSGTLLAQAAKQRQDMTFLHRGNYGHQSYALNVANTLHVGNFNATLPYYEDHELGRQGMYHMGVPWYIYTGVRTENRIPRSEQTDWLSSPGNPRKTAAHEILCQLWPEYTSKPPKRYAFKWKKFINDHMDAKSYPLEDISTSSPYDWERK